MTYDFQCKKCDAKFEVISSIVDRDLTLKRACPNCKKKNGIERILNCMTISYDTINPIRRAGSGWNDVLKKVAAPCGRHSKVVHY